MTTKRSCWSAASAAQEFKALAGNYVGKDISSLFSGSPKADRRQAAADARVMTAQPKPGKKPVGISWR